ncbi:general secretion pathway ATPase [Bordetella ansorpii]|uniref:General secretion pathway ATPase n=1 Tax=Bordetella ansorpii TaxID=288768 RepID=A0A157SNN9_9BORD|nr:ATPase, T2SS/T4P/T4SS family [Bordetella ansorpii]SAI72108.1 general secretion pathway ATPase [Bordetella ansorpii]
MTESHGIEAARRPGPPRAIPVLDSSEDLAGLDPPLQRSLGDLFDLAALSGRLCPVLFEDGRAALFALADYATGDQADEIERMLRRRGYPPASPPRYVVSAALLLSVARGQFGAVAARGAPARAQRSALAAMFAEFVHWGVRAGASDLHINVDERGNGSQVRYTVNGAYVAPACFEGIAAATLAEVLAVAWMDVRGGNGAVFDPRIEQQGRIAMQVDGAPYVLRWASLAADAGPSVCLRLLRLDAPAGGATLEALGYLPSQVLALERARDREGGAIVLSGIVGSGKSTTIATLMRGIDPLRKVITLEDPAEYLIENALQNTVGRSLDGDEAFPFAAKLRTIKRSAMNDLLIGEVRDIETGRAFMDLAGSGVSIYTTTHTGSALMIPERLASDFIGISRDFLAAPGVLKLLVYQTLLPRLCGVCALPLDEAAGWQGWAEGMRREFGIDPRRLRVRNAAGCPACASLAHAQARGQLAGCRGRTVVAEMFAPAQDDVLLDCIRRRDNPGLMRHLLAMPRTAADDPDMSGKPVHLCALYKASRGELDARLLARQFGLCDGAAPRASARTRLA